MRFRQLFSSEDSENLYIVKLTLTSFGLGLEKTLAILFLIITLVSCNKNKIEDDGVFTDNPAESNSIKFYVDINIETLYIVFLLADYPLLTPFSNTYKTSALKYFKKYNAHEAVILAKELVRNGFVADYAVNWLLQHSNLPEFKKVHKVNFPFDYRQLNSDSLELFRKAMIDFFVTSNCEKFFAGQYKFLEKMEFNVRSSLTRQDIIKVIEDYFGVKKASKYHVILSPLLHSGGFAVEITDTGLQIALIGPGNVQDSFPEFDKVYLEQDLLIHEFSHNYSNPIVEQFMDKVERFEDNLFPAVKAKVRQEGYSTWESFMFELIVRSTTIRIVEMIHGKSAATELINYEKKVGFEYVTEIVEELKTYEKNRDKYPSLKEFYPNIIKRLGKIKNH